MNLFKAFGLKKADKERGEDWWWSMVDIYEDGGLSYNEMNDAFDSAGVTDEEHEKIIDRSAANFEDEGEGRKQAGFAPESKPRPEPSARYKKFIEGFERNAPHMGWSPGQIKDMVRDMADDSPHSTLRQATRNPEWLTIGRGARNISSDEIPDAEGKTPETKAAGEAFFDTFRGAQTGQGGGFKMHPLRPAEGLTEGGQALPEYTGPTPEQMKKPSFQNASGLNKMDIFKAFGLKKAKKKERIPNPEGKNMAALINSSIKTDRERAHQILAAKRKKIMGIGGRSNKKQMLQHLDREFKDGGDFQEFVRVRPEPKSTSDTPAKTPAPTTTKTTPDKTPRSRSSIPKLNPPKTPPKTPNKEDSPW